MLTQNHNFDRLHKLYNLLTNSYSGYGNLYQHYLKTGIEAFKLELGIIAKIENNTLTVMAFAPEDSPLGSKSQLSFELQNTLCSEVIKQQKAVGYNCMSKDSIMCHHPAHLWDKLERFIAAPIWVNNKIYGSINFYSPIASEHSFTNSDFEFVTLMASGLGNIIERDLLEQEKNTAIVGMRESTTLFTNAFEFAPIGMALVSPEGKWLKVNRSLQNIVGYSQEDLLKTDFQSITYPEDLSIDIDQANRLLNGEVIAYQIEKRYVHHSGQIIWVNLSVSLVYHDDGSPRYFVSQIENIDERKHMEIMLANLASHDALTDLPNRRLFKECFDNELQKSLATTDSFSIAILDIDHFKRYNDRYGHLNGDIALKEVAATASKAKRQYDTLARFGGEEFILLLPGTDNNNCHRVCERIRQAIEKISNLQTKLTISIGCTTYTPDQNSDHDDPLLLEKLLFNADKALYMAKRQGRNQVIHLNYQTEIN